MSTSGSGPSESPGDTEIVARSTKKPKRSDETEEMEMQEGEETEPVIQETAIMPWAAKLFPKSTCNADEQQTYELPNYYMGEDDEEKYEGVDELFCSSSELEEQPPRFGPRLEISKEKYTSLFKKWRGALIVKLLGKSISYRTLVQRLRDIWHLEKGFELTDLEEGFFIVRFFSREDYLLVLEGGPWTILGHYLTVMKWRPMFKPTTAVVSHKSFLQHPIA